MPRLLVGCLPNFQRKHNDKRKSPVVLLPPVHSLLPSCLAAGSIKTLTFRPLLVSILLGAGAQRLYRLYFCGRVQLKGCVPQQCSVQE